MSAAWMTWGGSAAVLASTTGMGRMWAEQYRRRPRELRQLAAMLRALSSDIQYARTPLRDALAHAAVMAGSCKALQDLFTAAAQTLQQPGATGQEAIAAAVRKYWSKTALRPEDRDTMLTLSHIIGTTHAGEQAGHLQAAITELGVREQEALADRMRYERLLQTTGILIGVFIVILWV